MMEAQPVSEALCFYIFDEGKCPTICISLTTKLHQKPLDKSVILMNE
jgi:hypothetical protein